MPSAAEKSFVYKEKMRHNVKKTTADSQWNLSVHPTVRGISPLASQQILHFAQNDTNLPAEPLLTSFRALADLIPGPDLLIPDSDLLIPGSDPEPPSAHLLSPRVPQHRRYFAAKAGFLPFEPRTTRTATGHGAGKHRAVPKMG